MDDLMIFLPCGFSAKYKDIFYNKRKFPCPVCKSHDITSQDCFNMTRNKMSINEFNLDLKKKFFTQCLKEIEICKSDPKISIDENYQNLKNQLDIRREEIKLIVDKKIDDYYEDLLRIIKDEKEAKLNEFETKIHQISSLEKEIMDFKVQNTNEITNKMEIIEGFCTKIENGIRFLNKAKDDLENEWIFNPGEDILDTKKIFGRLDRKEIAKNVEIYDKIVSKGRNEGIFQFTIYNFANLKNEIDSELYSKSFKVKHLDWNILVDLNKDHNGEETMGFFLGSKSIINSNDISLNISVELRLLNLFDEEKDFSLIFEKVFDKDHFCWGFNHFISKDEIMDPNKGFYNFEKKSITLQVMLKIDGIQNSLKSLIEEKVTGIVRWYDEKNGFGFIARNDTNAKIFVRESDIVNMNTNRKSLKGKKVKFDIIMGAKGLEAVNVTGPNAQSAQGSINATRRRRRKIKSCCANHENESEE